jgi:hypothetical protein
VLKRFFFVNAGLTVAAGLSVMAGPGAASASPALGCEIRPENSSTGVAVTNQSSIVIGAGATFVIRLVPRDLRRPIQAFTETFTYSIRPGDTGFFYPTNLARYRGCSAELRLPPRALTELR